jgi:type IV pilus assembly protein PilX
MIMQSHTKNSSGCSIRMPAGRARQRGIVLFVALIVMVALSLAGIALIRSIDTSTSVTGNIAFRQAALLQANWAVEQAIAHLYKADSKLSSQVDPTAVNAAFLAYVPRYKPNLDSLKYALSSVPATVKLGLPSGVPCQLWKKGGDPGCDADYPGSLGCLPDTCAADSQTGNSVRYVVQRMCLVEGAPVQSQCDMMQPKQALGTTTGDEAINVGKFPLYRVTVRVDGPSSSVAFVQAMIRG